MMFLACFVVMTAVAAGLFQLLTARARKAQR
ncbi:hypothetical protein QFZ67_005007 [Streptomyces sp. V1I1]|nr:hypothetical protein [Streptomyces sp. V1I1]